VRALQHPTENSSGTIALLRPVSGKLSYLPALHPYGLGRSTCRSRFSAPIPIVYRGLFADQHLVDAQQFGKSLIGLIKIANSISHELFFETITHDSRSYQIRFCVGPSRQNGLLQELFAVLVSGQFPAFPPILLQLAKPFIISTFEAIIKTVLNRRSEASLAVDKIHDLAVRYSEFASQVHKGHMRDKAWLKRMVETLAKENRAPLREVPEPVGRTVRSMEVGDDRQVLIDEPTAEVLRARDPMELGDPIEYDVKIEGVFKTNGACRVRLLSENRIVPGKITDPALEQPHNIYTTALDAGAALHVIAKPVLKDGKLHRLFISHAEGLSGASLQLGPAVRLRS
jgi:hypothetical protein